ncbi:MAG: hypothetical protein NC308_02130 [Clostridium sp.]|nr:glycerophosphodiester phosphodiesterase [Bacteroides sp.]MCM1197662.1 hypothetical protein [Clostridium sp.]
MKNVINKIFILVFGLVLLSGCSKDRWPSQPDWDRIPDPSVPVDDGLKRPAECSNRVVAHMGGAYEAGVPANSLASVRYAMEVGAYGAECDVYWTKDDNIVVAHANGNYEINGLEPFKSTLAEIRAAGRLSNGEQLPTLEELINEVMSDGSCTRLVVDIKRVDVLPQSAINAARRVCEIVTEMGAKHFVHLLCTGSNENVMKSAWGYARQADLEIAMNSGKSAQNFGLLGFNWISMSAKGQMGPEAGGTGSRTLKEFVDAGISVSVYNVDRQAGDGNAVYEDDAVNWYVKNYPYFKTLSTNYPEWLIAKVASASERRDGISSMDDFEAFMGAVISDPSASGFADDNGVVHLKTDLVLDDYTPFGEFSGVLDGNGHTVTINYKGDSPYLGLMKKLTGTVRNLTIAGTIESTCEESSVWFGTVASTADGAIVENCTNRSVQIVSSPDASGTVFMGGMAGKLWNSCSITGCSDEGRVVYESGAALQYGGMFGANNVDNGYVTVKSCSSSAEINFGGTNSSAWNYVGGLAGKPASKVVSGSDWHLVFEDCSYSGTYTITGGAKVRGGQIMAYSNSAFHVTGCRADGTIENTEPSKRDFVVGGMVGMIEKNVNGLIEGCSFSGAHRSVSGPNNYIGGVFGNTADAATVVADNCTTSSKAYVGAPSVVSVGMLAGRPKQAGCTIRNCRIAGTVNKAGTETVITASNLEDWMFTGSGTAAGIVSLSGNGFNAE